VPRLALLETTFPYAPPDKYGNPFPWGYELAVGGLNASPGSSIEIRREPLSLANLAGRMSFANRARECRYMLRRAAVFPQSVEAGNERELLMRIARAHTGQRELPCGAQKTSATAEWQIGGHLAVSHSR
jgi:hypothetical protein